MKNKLRFLRARHNYAYFFVFSIIATEALLIYFQAKEGAIFTETANAFAVNFIEWFSVLYGLLLPLILIRTWEQFDDIEREFDKEVDVIKILYDDLHFSHKITKKIERNISELLRRYVRHVTKNYTLELKEYDKETETEIGDEILRKIKKQLVNLFPSEMAHSACPEFLVKELLQRLNDITDTRGSRIWFASQRLFAVFRPISLIASILLIIPFYILGFTIHGNLLIDILIFGITFFTISIYMIIEDLSKPYEGVWKIKNETWFTLRRDMVCEERQRRLLSYKIK